MYYVSKILWIKEVFIIRLVFMSFRWKNFFIFDIKFFIIICVIILFWFVFRNLFS